MPIRTIQSKQNTRLKQLRRAIAHPGREPGGLAGIEGPNLLEEAIRARLKIPSVFVAAGAETLVEQFDLGPDTEVLALPAELLRSALATETPQAVAALVEPQDWGWRDLLGAATRRDAAFGPAPLILVLAGVQDPGNLGTILRSAEAFGATGIVSLPGTVSAWNPKAVRASAGSVFRVPIVAASAGEAFARLREAGVTLLAALARDAQPADRVDLGGPVAVLIGNEGNGLSDDLVARAFCKVTIPCPGPVESLNAAVAAGVLLYEASRQRSAHAEARGQGYSVLGRKGARR